MSLPRRKAQFVCCFCRQPLIRRTSWLQHVFLRQEVYQCSEPTCGASFNATAELTHLASPTGHPNAPACSLPETPAYLRRLAQQVHQKNLATNQMDLLAEPAEELAE